MKPAELSTTGNGIGPPAAVMLFIGALSLRLAALPLSQVMDADATWRVWGGWRWAEDPVWITHHVWGPIHFYMIGLMFLGGGDPYWAPLLLHVFIGAALAPAVAWMTAKWIPTREAAWSGWAAAVAPLIFRASLMPLPELPAALATVLAFGCVASARDGRGVPWAAAGGMLITLAAGLRFEIWALIPVGGLVLGRRPREMILFLACASIFPIGWMISTWLATGNPLFSIQATSYYSKVVAGLGPPTSIQKAAIWIAFYPTVWFLGLTPPLAIVCLIGMWLTWRYRPRARVWLLPTILLGTLIIYQACIGNVTLKGRYFLVPTVLGIPFISATAEWARIRWSGSRLKWAAILMIAAAAPLGYLGRLGSQSWASVAWKNVEPIPTIAADTREVILNIRASVSKGEGLILDFIDWQTTEPIALATRLHPADVFITSGDAGVRAGPRQLAIFLENHPQGVILMGSESVFLKEYASQESHGTILEFKDARVPALKLTRRTRDIRFGTYDYNSTFSP